VQGGRGGLPGLAEPECFALLGPIQREASQAREPCAGEVSGLPPVQDGADDLWREKGEPQRASQIGSADAFSVGHLGQGAVADIVEKGGVISEWINDLQPALTRRWRSRHGKD
jgi:hypothetical protein